MAKQMYSTNIEREIWSIQIRSDRRGEPELQIQAEYVMRLEDGSRHVLKGMPEMRSPVEHIQDMEIVLEDGHATTVGACVRALYAAASEAVDQQEEELPASPADRRPVTIHEMLHTARMSKKDLTK